MSRFVIEFSFRLLHKLKLTGGVVLTNIPKAAVAILAMVGASALVAVTTLAWGRALGSRGRRLAVRCQPLGSCLQPQNLAGSVRATPGPCFRWTGSLRPRAKAIVEPGLGAGI